MVEFGAALSGEIVLPDPGTHSISGAELRDITMPRIMLPEATLTVVDAQQRAAEWVVKGYNTTLGSGEGSNIKLPAKLGVERVQCLIRYTAGIWHLEDLSKEGVRVNGARVRSIHLDSGDVLRLGQLVLRFLARAAPDQELSEDIPTMEETRGAWLEYATGDADLPTRISVGAQGVVIGRDANVDLLVSDPEVSRRHCIVKLAGRQVTIEDLESANGTHVDGYKVELARLNHGQVVRVGSTQLTFYQAK